MPKIKLKKASKTTVDGWYKKKRDYSITDNEIGKSIGLTRRRVSQALNRYEVNPKDIELITNFFNNY
ncbi:MAG TPA: hypothetical protein PK385_12715 [Spirochaetota bacterium]|jgi:hypothetical protein|nr:hypothetical protein [Spirochaetota bacterium]